MEFFGDASGLRGATLVMPAVTHANVGELAMDVLIATLQPVRVGALEDPFILPVVGNDAYDMAHPGSIATALELFRVGGSNLFLLQQRAPAAQGCQEAAAASLLAWLTSQGVGRLLVLCGLDAQLMRSEQLDGPGTRYVSDADTASGSSCSSLGWHALEADIIDEEKREHSLLPPWPLLQLASSAGLPNTLLATFASEGDNTPHALSLAGDVLQLLQHLELCASEAAANGGGGVSSKRQLRTPCSWAGLYGRSWAQGLY